MANPNIPEYGRRADEAKAALLEKPGVNQELVGQIQGLVNENIETAHRALLDAIGDSTGKNVYASQETWEHVEYDDGLDGLGQLIAAAGITDAKTIEAIHEYAYHHAVLKAELEKDDAPEADKGADFEESFSFDLN